VAAAVPGRLRHGGEDPVESPQVAAPAAEQHVVGRDDVLQRRHGVGRVGGDGGCEGRPTRLAVLADDEAVGREERLTVAHVDLLAGRTAEVQATAGRGSRCPPRGQADRAGAVRERVGGQRDGGHLRIEVGRLVPRGRRPGGQLGPLVGRRVLPAEDEEHDRARVPPAGGDEPLERLAAGGDREAGEPQSVVALVHVPAHDLGPDAEVTGQVREGRPQGRAGRRRRRQLANQGGADGGVRRHGVGGQRGPRVGRRLRGQLVDALAGRHRQVVALPRGGEGEAEPAGREGARQVVARLAGGEREPPLALADLASVVVAFDRQRGGDLRAGEPPRVVGRGRDRRGGSDETPGDATQHPASHGETSDGFRGKPRQRRRQRRGGQIRAIVAIRRARPPPARRHSRTVQNSTGADSVGRNTGGDRAAISMNPIRADGGGRRRGRSRTSGSGREDVA
jgi:hypothetical protein